MAAGHHSSEVRTLAQYSPVFRKQAGQCYRIKDTDKGPEVWEVKCFLSNRVPSERNPITGQWITLRWMLRVVFGRWSIESCFREGKEELGLDPYEVRGWRCVHRHFDVTHLSHLFCARVRQEYDDRADETGSAWNKSAARWTSGSTQQICPPSARRKRFEEELDKQQYYQRRNQQAWASHTKTRIARLAALGIDVARIKSCLLDTG